jgi:penicillin-binding protein 1C
MDSNLRIAVGIRVRVLRALRVLRDLRLWAAVTAIVVALLLWARLGPLPHGLLALDARPSTVVVDRHGEVLYEIRGADGTRGETLSAGALPELIVRATLAAEDLRFFDHSGIDPIAVGRAAVSNLRARRVVQGGSTISQQVAKLLLARQAGGAPRRGWRAKLHEAVVAWRLEHRLSKREILALYLNLAPYGNQITGAARAAGAYFGRDLAALTAAEAAFLAALPQQPTRFNPWRDAAKARPRQQRILRTMRDREWLSKDSYVAASAERLTIGRESVAAIASHFVEHVARVVDAASGGRSGAAALPRYIETTLDAHLQRQVQGIIAARRRELDAHQAANVAVAVLDHRTGEWLAWEGSGDYTNAEHGGAIDGVIVPRQPGSALKPFTYAAAFERGYHPATVLPDVPSQFPTAEPGVLYSPQNYDGRFRGPMLVRAALAGSENVPAVAIASEIGVPAILRLLRRVGFTTLDRAAAHYGLGLTLGNAEVTLAEMVAAYSVIARSGGYVRPRSIRRVDGHAATPQGAEQVMSERTAFWLADILSDDEARAFVFGRGGSLEFPFAVAAKTGTSQAYHDNWAVGFTSDVTVGVWVGNFDRRPLRNSSGVTGAGPIFHDVMLATVERVRGTLPIDSRMPVMSPTPGTMRREICATSGLTPVAACPRRTTEWVPADAAIRACTWHHESDEGLVTAWPEVYVRWAKAEGLIHDRAGSTRIERGAVAPAQSSPAAVPTRFAIDTPAPGAIFLLDPTLRREFQSIGLRSRSAAPGLVEWFVDGVRIGAAAANDVLRWPMTRGTHQVRARDSEGSTAATSIVVR